VRIAARVLAWQDLQPQPSATLVQAMLQNQTFSLFLRPVDSSASSFIRRGWGKYRVCCLADSLTAQHRHEVFSQNTKNGIRF